MFGNNKKSFSLIELLITLALVAVIIVFTVPRTMFFARFLVQAEINKLYSVFSYLQQRAIASNEEQELSFDPVLHTYQFKTIQAGLTTQRLAGNVQFGFVAGVKGPPSNPNNPIKKAVTFPTRRGIPMVSFMTNGKITPGSVYFVDGSVRCLGALTCPISQVSYVRRYAYDNGLWRVW